MQDLKMPQQTRIKNPTKWDIIPIHASDRAAFKYCRRQWGWSSPSRSNLMPRAAVYGIREPLWFGTGIHYALERYYASGGKELPTHVWETWFDLEWNGGIVKSDADVGKFIDRNPQRIGDGLWKIDGLRDILPMADEEHFAKVRDLGSGMMSFYYKWSQENDNFEVVSTEHDFSIPIFHPGTKDPLYWEDRRRMPEGWEPNYELENIYGPLMKDGFAGKPLLKQVHARGRMDMIKYEPESKQFGIQDYKTAKVLDEDYFRHLELDEQCTTYLWAGEVEAEMHGLEYTKLDFITYMGLFKGYPKPPTITTRNLPSINRKDESTTAALFEDTIRKLGIQMIFERDQKMQSYYTWLLELGDKRFIWPKDATRNKFQKANMGIRVFYETVDMLNDPRLYPSPKKEIGCLNCAFRVPCIAAESGGDYKAIIEDGYVANWDR